MSHMNIRTKRSQIEDHRGLELAETGLEDYFVINTKGFYTHTA